MHDIFPIIESRDEHDKRALRKVEVRDKGIDRLEFVAGVDENSGIRAHRMNDSVLVRRALKRAAGRRSDTNDSAAGGAARVYQICALTRDREKLGMHDVLVKPIRFYRTERAESDVEHDGGNRNSLLAQSVHKFGREVKSCSRSRRTSLVLGVDGLVAAVVAELFRDIGRQGHKSDKVQDVVYVFVFLFVVFKFDESISFIGNFDHLTAKYSVPERMPSLARLPGFTRHSHVSSSR